MGTPRGLPLLGGGQDRGLAYPSPVASRSCRRQALHETSRAFLEAGPHPQQLAAVLATRLADLIGGGCIIRGPVERVAAVVALVAARAGVVADRALALDVPVRQGTAGRGRDGTTGGLLDHVPVAVGESSLERDECRIGFGPSTQDPIDAGQGSELARVIGFSLRCRKRLGSPAQQQQRQCVLRLRCRSRTSAAQARNDQERVTLLSIQQ